MKTVAYCLEKSNSKHQFSLKRASFLLDLFKTIVLANGPDRSNFFLDQTDQTHACKASFGKSRKNLSCTRTYPERISGKKSVKKKKAVRSKKKMDRTVCQHYFGHMKKNPHSKFNHQLVKKNLTLT